MEGDRLQRTQATPQKSQLTNSQLTSANGSQNDIHKTRWPPPPSPAQTEPRPSSRGRGLYSSTAQTQRAACPLWPKPKPQELEIQTTFPTNTRQGYPCPTFSPTAGKLETSLFIITVLEDRPSPGRCGVTQLSGDCVRVRGGESRAPEQTPQLGTGEGEKPPCLLLL